MDCINIGGLGGLDVMPIFGLSVGSRRWDVSCDWIATCWAEGQKDQGASGIGTMREKFFDMPS